MTRRSDERGSALVEFALVIPVFLVVVIGAASVVWLLGARSSITGAARDGARFASIRHTSPACPTSSPCYPSADEVEAYVTERAGDYGVDAVTVTPVAWRNQEIVVTVTRELPNVFRTFGGLLGMDEVEYTSTARSRAE